MKPLIFILALIVCSLSPAKTMVVEAPPEEYTGPRLAPKGPFPNIEFLFKDRGTLVAKMSVEQMANRVPPMELTVLDPYSLSDEVYRGFPIEALFYAIYKEAWRRPDNEVVITRADGSEVALPAAKIIRFASYLTYERRGSADFSVVNERDGRKPMNVGPFYVVWDNFREPNLKDIGIKDWYTQVVSVNLIDFMERYPQMVPPPKSPQSVKLGFAAFRKYCSSCHTINGDGGARAVELNYPVSVTEYLSDKWLRKWILAPESIRFNTAMPALDRRDAKARRWVEDIIKYLRVMARQKKNPRVPAKPVDPPY